MSVSVMKRLTVVAFQEDAPAVLRRLVKLKCVEIRRIEREDGQMQLQKIRCRGWSLHQEFLKAWVVQFI